MDAYLNRVATVVPRHDVHGRFVEFAGELLEGTRGRPLFDRMANRSGIEHRWSVLAPSVGHRPGDREAERFYRRGQFPSTAERMRVFEETSIDLAVEAVEKLELGEDRARVTHLIAVSCTGLSAPGIDLQLLERCGLPPSVERTVVGFMGCYAAVNALKLARHIVRSDAEARVLIVSVELCTLHLQETQDLEQVLSFLVFGDGCAAALVSGDAEGLRLDRFHAALLPEAAEQITWSIGDGGFNMFLSGQVPASVAGALKAHRGAVLDGADVGKIDLWAIHPGGRSVLDAVQAALGLAPEALADSREVLRAFGNMSSATILFVLARILDRARTGERGCGMAFGPGLTAETLLFTAA